MDFKGLSNPTIVADNNSNSKPSFFQKIRQPFTKFSAKKTATASLVVMLVFALALGVYITRKPTQLTPQASLNAVDISIKPPTISTALNEEFQVDVFVDPGQTGFKLTGVQTKIEYDPAKLELKTVSLTDFLPTPLMQPQNTPGSTRFALGSSLDPESQSGIIAKITFKSLASNGSTQITFDNALTSISATEATGDVAGDKTGATVNFGTSSSPSPNNTNLETSFTLQGPASATPGQEFEVKVYSRSDIDNANLWNATINFPKDLVEVVRFNKAGSFITSWTEEFFSNSTGEISLTGGVTNPGLKTSLTNSLMTTIVFKAKTTTGTAAINLIDPTNIYRNSDSLKILLTKRNTTVAIQTTASPSPSAAASANPAVCGNGIQETGEQCDAGINNGACPKVCGNVCIPNACPLPSFFPSPSPSTAPQSKGDGNNDGRVDLQDLSIMFSKWSPAINITSHFKLDFNNDLKINSFDYAQMRELLKQLGVIRS